MAHDWIDARGSGSRGDGDDRRQVVDIRPATLRDACFVAANMREQDRAEIAALVDITEPAVYAALQLRASFTDGAFVAYERGQPIACFGVGPLGDYKHVAGAWAYGTIRMRRAVPAITRHCLDHIAPELVRGGYRRLEVRTSVEHDLSHKWLAGMGAIRESAPYEFGRNGEVFVTYGWGLGRWRSHPLCKSSGSILTDESHTTAG